MYSWNKLLCANIGHLNGDSMPPQLTSDLLSLYDRSTSAACIQLHSSSTQSPPVSPENMLGIISIYRRVGEVAYLDAERTPLNKQVP